MIKGPVYVYIAGPLSIGSQAQNVRDAVLMATNLREKNPCIVPFVPHLSHFWHYAIPHTGYDYWMDMDFAWLSKCDCLLRIPGESKGADMEVEFAKGKGIPVFGHPTDVLVWIQQRTDQAE